MDQTKNIRELIIAVSTGINGIGPKSADKIADHFGNRFVEFLMSDEEQLQKIEKSKGKRLLSDQLISEVIKEKKPFQKYVDVRDAWVYLIGSQFLQKVVTSINELDLSKLGVNPFLAISLELRDAKEIIEFNLFQSVTRSVVTSWGTTVEALLIRVGSEKVKVIKTARSGRSPDIRKRVKGREHLLQIKSGPNTMNVDMVNSLNEVIAQYKKSHPRAKFVLGMTYGRRSMISKQIRRGVKNFADCTLIGRELWDFIADEANFHRRVFKVLDDASKGILSQPLTKLISDKRDELVKEWKNTYGNATLTEVLEKFV